MSIETMKLALEAFENLASHWPHYAANMDMKRIDFDAIAEAKKSLEALRAAIEQAEKQEPVAYWRHESYVKSGWAEFSTEMASDEDTPLYTAPPRREWQGLTDEEIKAIRVSRGDPLALHIEFARAIEAKLKEKNT